MALDDSVSYLKALKQTVAQQAGSAAAPAPARDPNLRDPNLEDHPAAVTPGSVAPQPQFGGAEKRRSPRYKCEGSAEMREEGCDVRTWATFTDVSLHGCYVEAQATYPVGSVLHMKLAANGITVETKGTVRVSYPYLGMGIAFTTMSDEERKRLKELLGTLSHATMIMGPGIASSLPTCGPLDSVPLISDARAAIQALMGFFESHHMLTREEFLRVLRKSQGTEAKR